VDLPVRLVRSKAIEFAANSFVERPYLHKSEKSGCSDSIRFGSDFGYRFDVRNMRAAQLRINVGANAAHPWSVLVSPDDKNYVLERSGKSWPSWQTITLDQYLAGASEAPRSIYVKIQGIDCQVRELDWSIFLQRTRGKEFDAVILGWTGGVVFPPDVYQIWHSSQAAANGSNYVGFRNAEVDSLLEAYREEFDAGRRAQLYRRFQEIVAAEQPYTFLWTNRVARAYSRRFSGVTWYAGGADLKEWWVGPEHQLYP